MSAVQPEHNDAAFEGSPTSTAADVTDDIGRLDLSPSSSQEALSDNKTRFWIHPSIVAERYTRDDREVIALCPDISLILISVDPQGPHGQSLDEAKALEKDLGSWANSQLEEEMTRTGESWRQRAETMLESVTQELNTRFSESQLFNSDFLDVRVVKASILNSSAQELPGYFFKELDVRPEQPTGSPDRFSPIADLAYGWQDIEENDRCTTRVWLYPYLIADKDIDKDIEVKDGVDGETTVTVDFFFDVYLLTDEEEGQWTPLRKDLEAFESDMIDWFCEQNYGFKPDPNSNWDASLDDRLASFTDDLKEYATDKDVIQQVLENPHSEFEVVDAVKMKSCATDSPE